MPKITRLKPPIRPASVAPPSASTHGPAPVHSLLCYRLASFLLALETGEDWNAKDVENVLRATGVVRAMFRKVKRTYECRVHLSDGFTITYVASQKKAAWIGAVGLLHERVMNLFIAQVAS